MTVTQWVLLGLALVAVVVAVALWIWRSRVGAEMGLMASTETSRAADAASKPLGSIVELKGKLHADTLLTSEFAQQQCVYYRALTEREVERVSHNSKGQRQTSRSYETITDVKRFSPCVVDDGTGRATINLEGAAVEGKRVHQRRETEGLSLTSAAAALLGASGRTTAHRFTEWVLEPDTAIYVLGTALGGGVVGKATDAKKQPFIVSIKSEEQRTKSLRWTRLWLLIGAAVAVVVAIALAAAAMNSGA